MPSRTGRISGIAVPADAPWPPDAPSLRARAARLFYRSVFDALHSHEAVLRWHQRVSAPYGTDAEFEALLTEAGVTW